MKIKINFQFIIVFALVLFKFLKMQNYVSNYISNTIMIISMLIIFLEIWKHEKITNIKMNTFLLLIFLALIQIIFLHDIDLFLMISVVLVFANEKKAIRKIIKYFLISLTIVFIGTVILYLFGFLESAYLSRLLEDGTRIQRNSLGFVHPNETFIYFFFIIFALYYFVKKKKILFYIFAIISTYILYKITLCRTGMLCVVLFLIFTLFEKENIKGIKWLFFIGTLMSFIMAVLGEDINNSINQLLSIRPYIANVYLKNGAYINIIGNNLQSIKGLYSTIDNAYLYLILTSGIIFYLVYGYIYYKGGKYICTNKKLTTMYIIILIYSCFESHTLNVGLNFLLIIQLYSLLTIKNEFIKENNNEKN